ncbi:MAG: hypothetical protein PF545_04430 [Elusimicrobia bacterium]|jgi:hypothetical protein|nr:hypothetical protein [Elusimicrobiota bacterium]
MRFLSGSSAEQFLSDLVYSKKQVHKNCIDITAKKIYKLKGGAKLDFGGSEYKEAPKDIITPELKDKEDKYGWWELERDYYLVKYNERLTIAPGQKAVLLPHKRLINAAASQAVRIYDKSGEIINNLVVSENISIKENARLSRLFIVEDLD